MGNRNESDRAEGAAEELGGKIKKHVGKRHRQRADGSRRPRQGAQGPGPARRTRRPTERAKGAVEEVAGKVKNRVGAVIDNEQMQVEGKAKELKGQARQKANK